MCSFNQITTIDRDPTPTRTALKEFQTLLQKYPKSVFEELAQKNISICLDKLSEYELYVGRFYHKKDAFKAAAGRFDGLLSLYPGSVAEKDALYYDGLSYIELKDKDRARSLFETLITKYPSMKESVEPLLEKEKLVKN